MKNLYILMLLGLMLILPSCDTNEADYLSKGNSSVMFDSKASKTVKEDGGIFKLPVILAGLPSNNQVAVKFEVDIENSLAKEGVDFVIKSKELIFSEGFGVQNLEIEIIDNDLYEGDKTFSVQIASVSGARIGALDKLQITIVDDEHPLAIILGGYNQADYLLKDGSLKDVYPISINSIPGSITKVAIQNFWNGGTEIIAEVDLETNEISILPGQTIYVDKTYGAAIAVYIDAAAGVYDTTSPIVGTISENGIEFGAWGSRVSAGFFGTYVMSVLTRP